MSGEVRKDGTQGVNVPRLSYLLAIAAASNLRRDSSISMMAAWGSRQEYHWLAQR